MKIFFCCFLLLILHPSKAQRPADEALHPSLLLLASMSPQSLLSLLLLAATVLLSATIYLWVLRYICIGSCQPVGVGTDTDVLAGMV